MNAHSSVIRVLLMPTCLVDLLRPSVGFSAAALLRRAGCQVEVSRGISCCGQPAYNSGDRRLAARMAKSVVSVCESYDYVVLPSGSCAGMLRRHYPDLLADEPGWDARARDVAEKTFELMAFLTDVRGVTAVDASYLKSVTYLDSCSGLRELGIKPQPRRLLGTVKGLRLTEMHDTEVCCGFGGTFCVKYPDISNRMAADKCAAIAKTQAQTVLGGDLGCLMNIAGKLSRLGSEVEVRHVAEVLAGESGVPPLCGEKSGYK
jgi:L-lactate dehydrogenase complex protein LldE